MWALSCCFASNRKPDPPQSATIQLYNNTGPGKRTFRHGKLSYDSNAPKNWIARALLEDDLKVPWQQQPDSEVTKVHGLDMLSAGTVDLHWSYKNSPTTHRTTFDITSTYNPPFDVVLGREGMQEHSYNHGG